MTYNLELTREAVRVDAARRLECSIDDLEIAKVPKLLNAYGELQPWEPENSWIFQNAWGLAGLKARINTLKDYDILPPYEGAPAVRNFEYFTLAHVSTDPNSPLNDYALRTRAHFFRDDKKKRRFSELYSAIKSAGKSSLRAEFEAAHDHFGYNQMQDALNGKYGSEMPEHLRTGFQDLVVGGIICVSRAGFQGAHQISDKYVAAHSLSGDVCNITTPDIRKINNSYVVGQRYELEAEVDGIYHRKGEAPERDELIEMIKTSLNHVSGHINAMDLPTIKDPTNKTEAALFWSSLALNDHEIRELSVTPEDFSEITKTIKNLREAARDISIKPDHIPRLRHPQTKGHRLTYVFDKGATAMPSPEEIHQILENVDNSALDANVPSASAA